MITLKSKNVYGVGQVEVRDHGTSGYGYGLYIDGSLRQQTDDLDFIMREYDKIW